MLVRGDGVVETLEQLIKDFLSGSLKKGTASYHSQGASQAFPLIWDSMLWQIQQLKQSVGSCKAFLAALQKWQENGIRSSTKGLERLNSVADSLFMEYYEDL